MPDALWRYVEFGVGATYSDNQAEDMADQPGLLPEFDEWTDAFARHVAHKGKVQPGQYRAYGYRRPSHPIPGTSPAIQQERDLNRDATLRYKRGEGAKLRQS